MKVAKQKKKIIKIHLIIKNHLCFKILHTCKYKILKIMHVFLGLAGKTPDDLSQGSPVRKRERLRKIQDPGKKKRKEREMFNYWVTLL